MLALCWHNMPAHYAFYYASKFDGDLASALSKLTEWYIIIFEQYSIPLLC